MNPPPRYWTWRRRAKLSALLLVLGLFALPHQLVAGIATGLLVLAIIVDLIRLTAPQLNQRYLAAASFTKIKETRRLSGYTFFLASTTILFWWFPAPIAALALSCFIVSDLAAPVIGQRWLTREIVNHKTWGGALGIVVLCLTLGLLIDWLKAGLLSPRLIVTTALATAALDLGSFLLDDNLLVPLGTATILVLLS